MICIPCRRQLHQECEDLPRRKHFKGVPKSAWFIELGVTDPEASSWCYCHHVVKTDLGAMLGVKAVVE